MHAVEKLALFACSAFRGAARITMSAVQQIDKKRQPKGPESRQQQTCEYKYMHLYIDIYIYISEKRTTRALWAVDLFV